MRKQFFKRSLQFKVLLIWLVVACAIFAMAIVQSVTGEFQLEHMTFAWWGIVAAYAIILIVLPDNFSYWIKQDGDYIVFEMSETDHRRLLRTFSITNKNRKRIVLEDETGEILLTPYDSTVLEFLRQVRIEWFESKRTIRNDGPFVWKK